MKSTDLGALTDEELLACLKAARALEAEALFLLLRRSRMSREPEKDEILTIEEAAKYLRVSRDFLYRHSEELPFLFRLRGALRASRRRLDRWIASGGDWQLTSAAEGSSAVRTATLQLKRKQ